MQNALEMVVLGANAGQETYLLTYLLTHLQLLSQSDKER